MMLGKRCEAVLRPAALQDAYGTASFELRAPMSADLRMPTAANENLMVSVALHQLESKGLLNIRCGGHQCTAALGWRCHCTAPRLRVTLPRCRCRCCPVRALTRLGRPPAAI